MEIPFHKMVTSSILFDDVTRFSPIPKTDRDQYMEHGPKISKEGNKKHWDQTANCFCNHDRKF